MPLRKNPLHTLVSPPPPPPPEPLRQKQTGIAPATGLHPFLQRASPMRYVGVTPEPSPWTSPPLPGLSVRL